MTEIDVNELVSGTGIDLRYHSSLIYEATEDTASIIDGESGEIVFFDWLH